ncbi:uncharacterized protein LOC144657958 [Oculina patagonica]
MDQNTINHNNKQFFINSVDNTLGATSDGDILNIPKMKVVKPGIDKDEYPYIYIAEKDYDNPYNLKKKILVKDFIFRTFYNEIPDDKVVVNENGDKNNNSIDIINTLEYKEIDLENCIIIIQSVKIPSGKGRLYLSIQTVNRKQCIITIKNTDSICLARAIVTAYANLHPENYTTTQLKDGFNKSRKLQEIQAKELHNNANVEINDYGNSLEDVNSFASHLDIEINIIDSEQFNEIIYTANNGKINKIYLYKTRNHFDVIKSMTAFLNVAYYCHSCKKAYTRRDKHKCPQKCLSCFKYFPDGNKCNGKDVTCKHCNRVFHGKSCFKNHTRNRSKKDDDDSFSSTKNIP